MKERVLVVIPAYNEEKSIASVLLGLRRVAPDFDRIVVNDGSNDGTAKVVEDMGEKQLNLPCNLGYGRALQTGIKYALLQGYDIVVTIDADGQHRPVDAPALVNALIENEADVVIGSRFVSERSYRTSYDRRVGQLLFSHLSRYLIGYRIYDTTSGFKAIRSRACEVIDKYTFMDFHTETIVRLSLLDYKIIEYPIAVEERTTGRSMHSISSIFQYPLKTILLIVIAAIDVLLERRTR